MYAPICVTLEDAIRAFITAGYPLPVRALARRFGVCDAKVRRLARRLAKAQTREPELIPAGAPVNTPHDQAEQPSQASVAEATHDQALSCPRCGEPLDTDDGEIIGCVGCGTGWRLTERGLEPLPDQPDQAHSAQANLPPAPADQSDIDQDKVTVVCPRCGSQRSVSVDAYMLAEPRCSVCYEVMRPPADVDQPNDGYVDTEAWIDEWWREVDPSATPPTELVAPELLDGEIIPPEKLFLSRKVVCSRCGHQREVKKETLLPPLCPLCKFPMAWDG